MKKNKLNSATTVKQSFIMAVNVSNTVHVRYFNSVHLQLRCIFEWCLNYSSSLLVYDNRKSKIAFPVHSTETPTSRSTKEGMDGQAQKITVILLHCHSDGCAWREYEEHSPFSVVSLSSTPLSLIVLVQCHPQHLILLELNSPSVNISNQNCPQIFSRK